MTDFKVTKEDVGRIAIDSDGMEWELIHWRDGAERPATWRPVDLDSTLVSMENGRLPYSKMIKWKLKETTVWVDVVKYRSGSLSIFHHMSKDAAENEASTYKGKLVARAVPITYEDE